MQSILQLFRVISKPCTKEGQTSAVFGEMQQVSRLLRPTSQLIRSLQHLTTMAPPLFFLDKFALRQFVDKTYQGLSMSEAEGTFDQQSTFL